MPHRIQRAIGYLSGRAGEYGIDPDRVAVWGESAAKAVTARRPKTRYAVGYGARPIIVLRDVLPDRAFDAFIRRATGVPA